MTALQDIRTAPGRLALPVLLTGTCLIVLDFFIVNVALFTAASLICGLAPSVPVLVAGRFLQGAGGALISPTALAFLGVLYSGPARARAVGTYATAMGLAAASWSADCSSRRTCSAWRGGRSSWSTCRSAWP